MLNKIKIDNRFANFFGSVLCVLYSILYKKINVALLKSIRVSLFGSLLLKTANKANLIAFSEKFYPCPKRDLASLNGFIADLTHHC